MTLSGSLSSALSGLTAASRAAEIVSSNIANAMTEGYGRRELVLSARSVGSTGQGVTVTGVQRLTNSVAIGDRRLSSSDLGYHSLQAEFYRNLERAIGLPDEASSLSARIAGLDTALISAAAQPDSEARLSQVADAARGLTQNLVSASQQVQTLRARADDDIERQVAQVNDALHRVAELNTEIRSSSGGGRDTSALMDQRQQAIDAIAAIIPLREIPREGGTVALISATGATLLDGRVSELGFTPVGVITPEMTMDSGALYGLTLNGKPIAVSGPNSPIAGGSLASNFALRDDLAVQVQAQLDAVARDLIERFQDPAVDPTLAPGDAGLFTDQGNAFDPLNEIGLAQRLQLNPAVDPQQGGALWRLRDGIGATAPGAVGDATLLVALQSSLTAAREPASGGFMSGTRSFSVLAGDLISSVATSRLSSESNTSFAQGKTDALRMLELEEGVDTDAELQKLLLIEQAYGANARVVQMVDDMIKTLIGI